MSYAAHYRVWYTGFQDSHVNYGCSHCRYEIVGKKNRRPFLFGRFVLHLEANHLDALAVGTLVCVHCERENAEREWKDGACPECGAFSLLESRDARVRRELERDDGHN